VWGVARCCLPRSPGQPQHHKYQNWIWWWWCWLFSHYSLWSDHCDKMMWYCVFNVPSKTDGYQLRLPLVTRCHLGTNLFLDWENKQQTNSVNEQWLLQHCIYQQNVLIFQSSVSIYTMLKKLDRCHISNNSINSDPVAIIFGAKSNRFNLHLPNAYIFCKMW